MIRYRFRQVQKSGEVWVSPDFFEAPTLRHVRQAVLAGFFYGEPRQAETEAGELICGLDANGNPMASSYKAAP